MNEETIVITLKPDGSIQVDTKGFHGGSCLEAAEKLLDKAVKNVQVEKTGDYWKKPKVELHRTRGGS